MHGVEVGGRTGGLSSSLTLVTCLSRREHLGMGTTVRVSRREREEDR